MAVSGLSVETGDRIPSKEPDVLRSEIEALFRAATRKDEITALLSKMEGVLPRLALSAPTVTVEQSQKDFRRERVLLNEVPFIPDRVDMHRCDAFSITLKEFVSRAMRLNCTSNDLSADRVADIVIQRACRTSAGADSYFMVQKLLCVQGTFITQRSVMSGLDPPIRIDLFIANQAESLNDDEVHWKQTNNGNSKNETKPIKSPNNPMKYDLNSPGSYDGTNDCLALFGRSEVRNFFAIYDLNSIDEITGDAANDPPPWLTIEAVVIDETNFKSGWHSRRLQLTVQSPSLPLPSPTYSFYSTPYSSNALQVFSPKDVSPRTSMNSPFLSPSSSSSSSALSSLFSPRKK